MQENTDQNNSEYGHFFTQCKSLTLFSGSALVTKLVLKVTRLLYKKVKQNYEKKTDYKNQNHKELTRNVLMKIF